MEADNDLAKKNMDRCECTLTFFIPMDYPIHVDTISRELYFLYFERNEISNNVVCATRKASDQPEQVRSLIRAFDRRLNIL